MAFRKFLDQPFEKRQRRIVLIDAKDQLVLGIILAAKAGVVFVGVEIETLDRFQTTDGRREVKALASLLPRSQEESSGAIESEQVIDKWDCGNTENDIIEERQNLCTSRSALQLIPPERR
jgi:hypothetical protein